MMVLNILCDLFWLLWILPALLGALLWWLGTRKYNSTVDDYENKVNGLNGRIHSLEGDLDESASVKANLEGSLAITKGRMREMEAEMKNIQASMTSGDGSGLSASNEEINTLKSSLADCESNSKALKESLSKANNEIDSLKASLSDAEASSSGGDIAGALGDIVTPLAASGAVAAASGKSIDAKYSKIKGDNLQIIEGIGPKMESVLKENGVNSLSDLSNQSIDDVKNILGKYGDKYKIIDPTTWPQQAGYAAREDFDGLIDLQKKLDTGVDNAVGMTASKLEKYLIKTGALKSFKLDDLKAIEGIGPATEKLLIENGITTWRELANTDASKVKEILTAAGSRFALGDPTTWPKQAELAADGKFDELREYQDFLDGGRG